MGTKMDSFFLQIWSTMASKSDVDPKMAPTDARVPQDGSPRPKMTQKLFKNDPNRLKHRPQTGPKIVPKRNLNHKEKRFIYITIPEPDWTLLQTFRNQLARRYTSRRLLNRHHGGSMLQMRFVWESTRPVRDARVDASLRCGWAGCAATASERCPQVVL